MYPRSFALLVSLVCATSAFAAPVPSDVTGLISDVVSSVDIPIPSLPPVVGTAVADVGGTVEEVAPIADILPRALPSLPQIFQNLSTKITPFVNNLKAAVADKANVDVELVKTNLQNIVIVLSATNDELKTFAKNPAALINSLLSINGILTALGPALQLLFTTLAFVMNIVAATPLAPVITPLIATIGSLVGSIISLALQILPGLLDGLLPTLSSLVPALGVLDLNNITSLVPL